MNALEEGAIDAYVYKADKLFFVEWSLAPNESVLFEFEPALWIGVGADFKEGQPVNAGILSDIHTELSLAGIARADIVMTGGGPNPDAEPLRFTMENIERD